MIKTVGLFQRREDLKLGDFRAYYENEHAPLGLSLLEFDGYVRNYPRSDAARRTLGVDGLSEFWFADAAAMAELKKRLGGDAGQKLREDELRFMSPPHNHSYAVHERSFGIRPEPGSAVKAMSVVTLPVGILPGVVQLDVAGDATRRAERGLDGFVAALYSRPTKAMKAPPAGTPAVACIESLWLADRSALDRCNALRARAGRTPLAEVEECGTPKP